MQTARQCETRRGLTTSSRTMTSSYISSAWTPTRAALSMLLYSESRRNFRRLIDSTRGQRRVHGGSQGSAADLRPPSTQGRSRYLDHRALPGTSPAILDWHVGFAPATPGRWSLSRLRPIGVARERAEPEERTELGPSWHSAMYLARTTHAPRPGARCAVARRWCYKLAHMYVHFAKDFY